jgi:hypothetical protein
VKVSRPFRASARTSRSYGAIATKPRDSGGHVFLVVGRTRDGRLVGRGGNQQDMVCDAVFDPSVITAYTWPKDYPQPLHTGLSWLPIVEPAPRAKRDVALPSPTRLELPAKGVVPPPKVVKDCHHQGVPAGGARGRPWIWGTGSPPTLGTGSPPTLAGIALVGTGVVGGAVYALNRWPGALR